MESSLECQNFLCNGLESFPVRHLTEKKAEKVYLYVTEVSWAATLRHLFSSLIKTWNYL